MVTDMTLLSIRTQKPCDQNHEAVIHTSVEINCDRKHIEKEEYT